MKKKTYKGTVVSGRPVDTEDLLKAGLIPGEPKKRIKKPINNQ